jgi:hypothetical protein
MRTRVIIFAAVAAAGVLMTLWGAEPGVSSAPEYTNDNQLVFPSHYREWIFLSSGLGMTYGPAAEANRDRGPMFDNVFVTPAAYHSFLETGKWPEKTMFALEIRAATGKGSINNGGHYQSEKVAVEVEVKDTSRFSGNGWAFFGFGQSNTSAKMIPASGTCYTCHPTKGAVDNTFVQFYPTLLPIAKQKGTLNPAYVAASAAEGR